MENYDDYVGVHLNNVHSTDSYTHTVIFDVVLVSDETKEMCKWMLRLFIFYNLSLFSSFIFNAHLLI